MLNDTENIQRARRGACGWKVVSDSEGMVKEGDAGLCRSGMKKIRGRGGRGACDGSLDKLWLGTDRSFLINSPGKS